jgi:hypothetical protein
VPSVNQIDRKRLQLEVPQDNPERSVTQGVGALIVQHPDRSYALKRSPDTCFGGGNGETRPYRHLNDPFASSSRNGQVEAGDRKSKFTHGSAARSSGDLGTPRPARRFGLAHTTARIEPMRVATKLLSGSGPIRTAIST